MIVVEIIAAALQKHLHRLLSRLANPAGIHMSTRIFVKLPIMLYTLLIASGRSHATVKAQIRRCSRRKSRGRRSFERLYFSLTAGNNSSRRNRAYSSPRNRIRNCDYSLSSGSRKRIAAMAGFTKIPMVTGISPCESGYQKQSARAHRRLPRDTRAVLKHHHARRLLRAILPGTYTEYSRRVPLKIWLQDVRLHLAARHAVLPLGILRMLVLRNLRLRLFLILDIRRGENPFRGFGENGTPMPPAVAVIAPNHLVLVALVLQRGRYLALESGQCP